MKPIHSLLRFSAALLALAVVSIAHAANVRLTWQDNSSNEAGFRVQRSTTGTSYTDISGNLPANTETWDDTNQTAGTRYWYRVYAFNSAGNSGFSNVVDIVANARPTVSAISDRSIDINTSTGPIAFTVADPGDSAGALTITVASSNPVLVPVANIALGGMGGNRTITVSPVADRTGTSVITLTVSDGVLTAQTSFTLTVVQPPPATPTTLSVEPF